MDKLKFISKCIAISLIPFFLNFLFVGDIHSYTRVMINELYEDEAIDLLFLGASHTYRGIDVNVIETMTGLNVFNASSSSQNFQGSYYLLNEAIENVGVNTALLDVTYNIAAIEEAGKTETYIITDYVRNTKRKYEYLKEAFGMDGMLNGILPILHTASFSPATVREHLTGTYRNNSYEYVSYDNERYKGKGFVYSYEIVGDDFIFSTENKLSEDQPISEFSMIYLRKIIALCKQNGIRLILINPPMPDGTLVSAGEYQSYIDALQKLAFSEGLEYWDFNLIKKEYMTLERTDFKDEVHLNGIGAEKFSRCISYMFNESDNEPFYENYEQKLLCNPDGTYVI